MRSILSIVVFTMSTLSYAGGTVDLECISETSSGKTVVLSACIEDDAESSISSVVACNGEASEYVTISRSTSLEKQSPDVVETIQIPGRLFNVDLVNGKLKMTFQDRNFGSVKLVYVKSGAEKKQTFNLSLKNFKHKFRAVDCSFD